MKHDKIMIIDYGSQYTQLITRRIRELKVYAEIFPYDVSDTQIKSFSPKAIILSGGPSSVYDDDAYTLSSNVLKANIPILGICYGLQLLNHNLGGKIVSKGRGEYGLAKVSFDNNSEIFKSMSSCSDVWMSHGDEVDSISDDWDKIAESDNGVVAALQHKKRPYYGVQFHPEVVHTKEGTTIISNFLFNISNCTPSWTSSNFVVNSIESIRESVGPHHNVVCGLSGGVDSSVMATLMHRAIGDRSKCIFVDHGLLRKDEADEVMGTLRDGLNLNITKVQAEDIFLEKLQIGIELDGWYWHQDKELKDRDKNKTLILVPLIL